MRILMIVPQVFYSTRGTPLSAYHRTRDLVSMGHQVEVLTYKIGGPAPDPALVVHRSRGPHFFREIRQGPSYPKIWFDALLLLRLIELLVRRRPDLLYAHEEGGFLAALVAPIFGVPLVYDMHSSLPLQVRDWKFSDRAWVARLFELVERFTLERSVAAIAISPAVAEAARRAAPGTPVEIVVNRFEDDVPASEDDRARIRRELGIDPGRPVVLYTGSFVALQSLDLLVRAVPSVARAVPQALFVLVGGKPDQIASLGQLVKEVGVEPHVRLLPARPQREMPAFAAAADVLVSPRIQGINPPGKLFSYLSSGRPVVATDCPVHNQILDARCAILTRPDPESFAGGVIAALTDAERARGVVAAAEEVLRERYDPRLRFEAYRRIFRRAGAPGTGG
jgi:glycosyltransferase involved in cell wall biosynthesis